LILPKSAWIAAKSNTLDDVAVLELAWGAEVEDEVGPLVLGLVLDLVRHDPRAVVRLLVPCE
jgi:hypothetical protein